MQKPTIPANEEQRQQELDSFNIIGAIESSDFDFITHLAAQICGTKISLISLVTNNTQWFLSHHGLPVRETPRDFSFCAHAINTPSEAFIIEDARVDERFSDNPLTTGDPYVIFYAGIPLLSDNGFPLGSLCVIDNEPKKLNEEQLFSLNQLAKQVVSVMELRRKQAKLDEQNHTLALSNQKLQLVQEANKIGTWELDINTGKTTWSDLVYEIHEVPLTFDHNKSSALDFYHPNSKPIITKAVEEAILHNSPFDVECQLITQNGHIKWVHSTGIKLDDKLVGSFQDITARKEHEEALRISEEAFRGNFENAAVGMALLNEKGAWLRVNKKVCEIVGYTQDELVKLTFQDITHPDDLNTDLELLNELIRGERDNYQMEKRYIHKNGQLVYIILAVSVVKDANGKILYFISQIVDVTEQKVKENHVKQQQQILTALFKQSPIGLSLNDYETGSFIDVNDKLIEPTGYTKEEFLALSYWDVTPKEYEKFEQRALEQMKTLGYYEKFEKEYITKDGKRYPIALQGCVVDNIDGKKLIWSFVQDISREKEAEQKLKEAIIHLQSLLDASTQVAVIATDTNGLITKFNSGAQKMLGYTAEEVVGKETPQLVHLANEVVREGEALSGKHALPISGFDTFIFETQNGKAVTKEWTYKRKDGTTFPVQLSVTAIYDEQKITGYLGVATDISMLKKVEEEIKSLLDITNEQNARLRNFAHIVSHNLRSHSAGISGLMNIILEDYPEIAANEIISLISKGADNLRQTVEDLTEVVNVNLTDNELLSVNLHDIIEKNTASLSLQIKQANFHVQNQISTNLQLHGVPAYIDSIVLNFITNAIKYRSTERDSYLKIYANETPTNWVICFEDNGQGIDLKKHAEKLFGMYKTFHYHNDSRGVGLFITKNQIESMGGKIEVKSEVNIGTTFIVYLPK